MTITKTFLFLWCVIFGFAHAQKPEQLYTEIKINQEIAEAKKLAAKDIRKTIEIAKNAYQYSKIIDYKKGMLESSTLLMAKYFDLGNFKNVIELSKETENLAIEARDYETLSNTYRLRASTYTELGLNDECLKEIQKAIDVAKKIESKNYRYYQQALIYNGLASYNAHINAPMDSVVFYQKKCLETITNVDNHKDFINKKYYTMALSYLNLGMTSVATKRVTQAKFYFSKALEICQNKNYKINKDLEVKVFNEFAWLYYDQKKYTEAVHYGELAEKMEKQVGIPYIRRDIFEVLFKAQVEMGNRETSSKYMNLYTKLNDSLVNAEKKTINTPIKHIVGEKEVSHGNNIQRILIATICLVLILIIAGWLYSKREQLLLHKKYEKIIHSLKNEEKTTTTDIDKEMPKKANIINDDTTNTILQKLNKFETSQKFLQKDISLTKLASSFGTNTRTLSEIIKQHRGKSFNNYINGLRVLYITDILYKDSKYRDYKISYLSQACGFASREVFAVVFKKETGMSPSYFVSKLKEESDQHNL